MTNHQLTLYDSETVFGSMAVEYFSKHFLVNDITLEGTVNARRSSSGECEAQYRVHPTQRTVEHLARRGLLPFGYTDPLHTAGYDNQTEAETHIPDALASLARAVEEADSQEQLETRVQGNTLTISRK